VIARYSPNIGMAGIREVTQILCRDAPVSPVSSGGQVAHLSVVANGIWNHDRQELEPYTPEYIFLARASCVAYDQAAQNVHIKMPDGKMWDIESWIAELSDDPEVVELLREIIGAIVRPNVRWNKTAWFYAEQGNNGKGTLCELMANLAGEASTATLSIKDFDKNFMLEPLTRASTIINDENDVGTFIDAVANLKAIITNDRVLIDRKHQRPIPHKFWGFIRRYPEAVVGNPLSSKARPCSSMTATWWEPA
jgi:putative DNA primase/helicase